MKGWIALIIYPFIFMSERVHVDLRLTRSPVHKAPGPRRPAVARTENRLAGRSHAVGCALSRCGVKPAASASWSRSIHPDWRERLTAVKLANLLPLESHRSDSAVTLACASELVDRAPEGLPAVNLNVFAAAISTAPPVWALRPVRAALAASESTKPDQLYNVARGNLLRDRR
jgi:hypothetical protein